MQQASTDVQQEMIEGLVAMMPMPKSLDDYLGIKPGDERKLVHKEGFGHHWDAFLDDTYIINEVVLTSMGRRVGTNPRTNQYDPKHVNVLVQSKEHPEHHGTICIEHFLHPQVLEYYQQ